MAAIGAGWVDGAWIQASWVSGAWLPGIPDSVGLTNVVITTSVGTVSTTNTGSVVLTGI